MIVPPSGVRVLVATRPIDFRRGADGLTAIVQTVLHHDPFCGTIYVFRSKRADRVKLLVWDGSGLVLLWNHVASYCISYHVMWTFCLACLADRCCPIGEPVPSAALLERRVWPWRFIEICMGVVGMPRDEAVLDPPDQSAFAD